jgi:hypothetical protein
LADIHSTATSTIPNPIGTSPPRTLALSSNIYTHQSD